MLRQTEVILARTPGRRPTDDDHQQVRLERRRPAALSSDRHDSDRRRELEQQDPERWDGMS